MSHARITTSLALTRSSSQQSRPQLTAGLILKTTLLFILAQIHRTTSLLNSPAQFEALYMPDNIPENNTWFKVRYSDELPFSEWPRELSGSCGMVVGTPANNTVTYKDKPTTIQCTYDNAPTGPVTEFYTQTGHAFPNALIRCIDGVFKHLCTMYNDANHQPIPYPRPSEPSSMDLWWIILGIAAVGIFVSVVACVVSSYCKESNNSESTPIVTSTYSSSYSSPSYHHHHHHHSDSGGSGLGWLGLLAAGSSTSSSSSSSATSGYQGNSASTAERTGTTWNFS
jgi:hypothetical protein